MNKKMISVAMAALLTQSIEGMTTPIINCSCNNDNMVYAIHESVDSVSFIEKVVKETVAHQVKSDKSEILLKSNLTKDLGADSLDVVEIVMTLEKKYGFEFSDDELNGLKTVGDLVTVIEKRKKTVVKKIGSK